MEDKREQVELVKRAEYKFVVRDMQAASPGDMDGGTVEVESGLMVKLLSNMDLILMRRFWSHWFIGQS